MANPAPQRPKLDRYVVIHVATTCDEHGVYVTKDSAEVIEIGWILLDASNCEELHRESVLVKPVNTPITPLCTSLTTLTWEHVRNAGTFRDIIERFSAFAKDNGLSSEGSGSSNSLEFAFVTLDSWDLRVQLPREARDKAVVLPPYLQHARVFDLRTEYQRWQQYHPESLPFGPSSLANICAALEVEPVQSSAPIKHNLPFHLQALAPASPRRAMEEAVTLARVLKGLMRKSQPLHEHQDVLTRPLDARADVRAFLSERSKVLHMSGLPHDTTQSELESWFTQFGGRPIAFWTLRTPDQHKPTGSGFAVFSSHEEAAESLCMNGRALNEKAIEVAPSSSRVLDRAAEILTPFPPSKNRPRPGDWTCPSCGFSNFQRRTACFRCSYPAGGPETGGHANHGHHGPGYGGYQGGYGGGYGQYGGHMGGGGGHHGPHHGPHHGGPHHGGRGGSGPVPFRAGDWKCGSEGCGYHNFAKNVACLRCGASRAGAAVVADSSFAGGPPPMMGGPPGGHHGGDGHGHGHGYGMGPPPQMGGPPGPIGGTPGYGTPGSQFNTPYGSTFGGSYGAPAPGGYGFPPSGPNWSGAYGPGPQSSAPGSAHPSTGGFDSRATQDAFNAGQNQNSGTAGDSNGDPFAFLNTGLGGLSIADEGRGRGAGSSGPPRTSA